MSNKPILLSDNFFDNVILHPTFAVANFGGDDTVGREAFRVADNLRDLTSWTPSTQNAARTIYVDCLAAVTPNIIILDRGHNLAGRTFTQVGATDATFAAQTTAFSATIPSTPGGLASDANGCLTPDGVWWKTFSGVADRVQSLQFPAYGAGIAPIVTGIYLGVAYRFPEYLNAPAAYDYGTQIKYLRNEVSRGGVRSKSRPLNFDKLPINIHLDSADYTGFDTEARRLFRYNQPWWFCLDDSDATGSGLMRMFQLSQDADYRPQVNPVHREISFDLEEVIPTLYT